MTISYNKFIVMSALIHPENQKIIWNIINSNIYVNDFFQTHTNVSKDKWFRSIIEKFYMQNEGRNLSIDELNNLNKDVLTFMVKSIHSIPPQQSQPPPQQPQPQPPSPSAYDNLNQNVYSPQIQTPPYIPNNIAEQNNRQFEEKKQEYEQMYAKPVPPEVDFREKEKDTIIENMDELINKHLSEREEQLKELRPTLVNEVNEVKPVVSMPKKDESKTDVSNNITFQVNEPSPELSDETPLKIQIIELKETMKKLQESYDELKDNFTDKIQSQAIVIENLEKNIETMRMNANKIRTLDQQSEKSDD